MALEELNLEVVIGQLQGSARDKGRAFDDLKHILQYNARNHKMDKLKDRDFLHLFQAIFVHVSVQRSKYGPRKRDSDKPLAKAAEALRFVVELCSHRLRAGTRQAVLNHIIETLPSAEEGICEPLAADYLKCLKALLEYPPHVERLSNDTWKSVVDFCTNNINLLDTGSESTSFRTQSISRSRTERSSTKEIAVRESRPPSIEKKHAYELMRCLHLLTDAPNAPIASRAESIVTAVSGYLEPFQNTSSAHYDAFACINLVLKNMVLESAHIFQRAVQRILPIIKNMWSLKRTTLHDQILITLVLCQAHFPSMLKCSEFPDFSIDLNNIAEVLFHEYSRRQGNQQLQADHLSFRTLKSTPSEPVLLHIRPFCLSTNNLSAEEKWMTVSLIAKISALLDERKSGTQEIDNSRPKKRSRNIHIFQEYVQIAFGRQITNRVAALQVLTFMAQECKLELDEIESLLDKLSPLIHDENSLVASWVLILLASLSFHAISASPALSSHWATVWRLASRNMMAPSSSRAACHVMDLCLKHGLVAYASIADTANGIISSIELHGPATVAESSISLVRTILHHKLSENPGSFAATSERIVQWLFTKWAPNMLGSRPLLMHNSHNYEPRDILRLLYACTDRNPLSHRTYSLPVLGPIAQAWNEIHRRHSILHYLLLAEDTEPYLIDVDINVYNPESSTGSGRRVIVMEAKILDYLTSELDRTSHSWKEWVNDKPNSINAEIVRTVASLCVAGSSLIYTAKASNLRQLEKATQLLTSLVEGLTKYLTRPECEQSEVDAAIEILSCSLPNLRDISSMEEDIFRHAGVMDLSIQLSRAMDTRNKLRDSFSVDDDAVDFMDVDDGMGTQISRHGSSSSLPTIPHHDLSAQTSILALRMSTTAYAFLVSSLGQNLSSYQGTTFLPSSLIDYLISADVLDLISCRHFLKQLAKSGLQMHDEDIAQLLYHFGESVISLYPFGANEVVHNLCLQVMSMTVFNWSTSTSDDIKSAGSDLYEWFVNSGLEIDIFSDNAQVEIADMLQRLLKSQPDYVQDSSSPSVRTSLFSILQKGSIFVKSHITDHLSEVFGLFVLARHDDIFNDIHVILPMAREWTEGIAIRLLLLSRLASKWHTLLRRGVYHIFETAAMIPTSIDHAAYCIREISRALSLEGPRSLFGLFARQLLYTWLDQESLESIPFAAFGYPTLTDLLKNIQDEVIGQLAMRRHEDQLISLGKILGSSVTDLLVTSFGQAAGYAISWDTCANTHSKQSQGSEVFIRNKFEAENRPYRDLIKNDFPQILGLMICSTETDGLFEKALAKRPAFHNAAKILKEIQSFSYSGNELPPGQQPSFNARFLLDQIERLCRRLAYDPVLFWTPDIFIRAMRMIISRIDPPLGSLHACSMIRKMRILIALAGSVATEGYPLHMTLQALRPYLTDAHCAEDSLGIAQYLYTHGKDSLISHIPFVVGIGLSTSLSLRVFIGSSQDATTQESQHIATMTKAQTFRSWFISYLGKYYNEDGSKAAGKQQGEKVLKAFGSMIESASAIRSEGNARRDTAEGKLLMELLDDDLSGRKLLNGPSRDLAFRLLCQNFEEPPPFQNDILGLDQDAVLYAAQVWKSCQQTGLSSNYLSWGARVLGRTFAGNGKIPIRLQRISRAANLKVKTVKDAEHGSEAAIISSLIDLLSSDDQSEVGLAESTLRLILARFEASQTALHVGQVFSPHLITALSSEYSTAKNFKRFFPSESLSNTAVPKKIKSLPTWSKDVAISLIQTNLQHPLLGALPQAVACIPNLAEQLLPLILHLILREERDTHQNVRQVMSTAFTTWFNRTEKEAVPFIRVLLVALVYLRTQPVPRETTRAERDGWLELDYSEVANAAVRCGMHPTALLFAETYVAQSIKASRRASSAAPTKLQLGLQLEIYKNLDDPDAFYGVEQNANLGTILERLDHEADGVKSLLFRGAHMDSTMRLTGAMASDDTTGIVHSLLRLNLNSITHSLLSNNHVVDTGPTLADKMLQTARKLEQWDIRASETNTTEPAIIFRALQCVKNSSNQLEVRKGLEKLFSQTMEGFSRTDLQMKPQRLFRTLGVLTEIDEITCSRNSRDLEEAWNALQTRKEWMKSGHLENLCPILSCRETLLSILSANEKLQANMHVGPRDLRELEAKSLLDTSKICRKHGALQESLASATHLANIITPCKDVGLDIEYAAQFEVAGVLWDQGEMSFSIRMLQELNSVPTANRDQNNLDKAVLLSTLGCHIADARLEKPDEIMRQYLTPAIKSLKGNRQGEEAGKVFHDFAVFCDQQLQNTDLAEEIVRMQKLMEHKQAEIQEYEKLSKAAKSTRERDHHRSAARKSKKWYEIDAQETQRLRASREVFLRQSLENYLLSLEASENYNNDALRVFALWLEFSEASLANEAVRTHMKAVPSRKFAMLMNQLSSRLQAEKSDFQSLLADLVLRICIDHPYHGMHQIFAGVMPLVSKDEATKSRHSAAKDIARQLRANEQSRGYYSSISESNSYYHDLAFWKDENSRSARDQLLEKVPIGKKLMTKVPGLKVPPATLNIELRSSRDYNDVPKIIGFRTKMSIANGLSAPKVVTAIASDGQPYKQLFKSGNDDLRQDAIMEQVFEQVSKLLKSHTETRLRELHIRTYKVLPLSGRSGIIEFVQNTIPLHDFLMRAHERYYPKDFKPDYCRNAIYSATSESTESRVRIFRNVMEHFHPIGRYFFLERFEDPDEWFTRRLAYTRSTAAISILGHVLGLGDRHCHNILLDERSGEVVHIDLGVAFEAGRVLPVPEVVPFRLTRDLVDAMGYTKTEGAFRRCCEFTMKTLRDERESIMTLLNVLRYDPLVNWTISPLKAKRMQDAQEESRLNGPDDAVDHSSKKAEDDSGEAGRALSVVEKKLAKGLSAAATVNELIQQATDERNLAVLYCGWSAYA